MKTNSSLTKFQEEVWKYHTKIFHDTGNTSITVFKIADHFSKSDEEIQEALEALAAQGIESVPPNWAALHTANLLEPRLVAELEPEKKPKPKQKPKPEKESPPPTDDFDSIFQTISERETQEVRQSRNTFTEDQLKSKREKRYKAVQANARNRIETEGLKSKQKFRECQICGKPDPEIYIPNLENPLLINVLCHSHLMQERNDPKEIPTISIREEVEKKRQETGYYNKNRSYQYKKRRARNRKLRFVQRFDKLIPPLHCAYCGDSEENTEIQLILPDADRPFNVIPMCRSCQGEIRYNINNNSVTLSDLKRINLVELVGIHFPPDLEYSQYEIMKNFRKYNKGIISCYVCDKSLEETELYVDRVGKNGFYLACPDCLETAKEDFQSGVTVHSPINLDLKRLNL